MLQLRLPHQALRPSTRPFGAGAQLWWRYAMKAVCSQRRHGRYHWVDIARYLKVQREYVPLYVMHLRSKDGAKDVTRLSRIAEMDKELPTAVALHFRKLAHAQDMRLKEKEQKKASEDKPQPRTWVSWLGFTGNGAPPAGAPPPSPAASTSGDTAGGSSTTGEGGVTSAAPKSLAAKSEVGEGSQAGDAQMVDPAEPSVVGSRPAAVSTAGSKEERGFLTADEVQVLEEVVQAQVCIVPMPGRMVMYYLANTTLPAFSLPA
jgi:Vacuolar sorting-associated protein 13, N-terminal